MKETETTIEQILKGEEFTFKSFRKPGRVYKVTAILRQRPMCDLFIIKSAELKLPAGIFNAETISPIIEAALSGKPQSNFRIR